jgi:hypothetical protein
MDAQGLRRRFQRIGAEVHIRNEPWLGMPTIDVVRDRRGEHFTISFEGRGPKVGLEVVDAWPAERHLLLLVRNGEEKSKFLLGHDERHWFVAAIPEDARGVSGVAAAMKALQPEVVQDAVRRKRPKDLLSRRNAAFVRQGEWFFVPEPTLVVDENLVLHDEPLSRGFGSEHWMENAFRRGGETVYVSRLYPRGLTGLELKALPEGVRRREQWTEMVRDAEVFARGRIRHPDHATIVLRGWHRVAMNTEQRARAMRHVAFLD